MSYLYGASVQGIQEFIFATNKLKEIAGASNLIEWFVDDKFIKKFLPNDKYKILRNAGGNIRVLFENKEDLEQIVKNFTKNVMQEAYGITISQAVVEFDKNASANEYLKAVEELERDLTFARNKSAIPLDSKFNILKQTSRTGKPLYQIKNDTQYDKSSWQKFADSNDAHYELLLKKLQIDDNLYTKFDIDMEKISNNKNKIAVIHVDGNKMGLLLQSMKNSLLNQNKSIDEIQTAYKNISNAIESATKKAVQDAYKSVFSKYEDRESIPFRPIVIGGDDVTFVCSANDAVEFTKHYLKNFEEFTKENFKDSVKKYNLENFKDGLTACAGITFCNEKFPFHYAVELAESLCSKAKKVSKRENSCLIFHNVQSSYFSDYESYEKDELVTKDGYKLIFAPYYIDKKPKIDDFLDATKKFSNQNIPLGKLRAWIGEINKNFEYSQFFMQRVISILDKKDVSILNNVLKELNENLSLQTPFVHKATPIYDILSYISVVGAKDE